jgi:Xaa-Pro aminopeptidase
MGFGSTGSGNDEISLGTAALTRPDHESSLLKQGRLDPARLAQFSDVRGLRIEDDVLVTDDGAEVLTAAIPKRIADVEAVLAAR